MSANQTSVFASFSHPAISPVPGLMECLTGAFANVAVQEAVQRGPLAGFEDVDGALTAALRQWCASDKTLAEVWQPGLAKLGRFMLEQELDGAGERLGRVCLELAPRLPDFAVRFRCASGMPLYVGGHVFAPGGEVEASSRDGFLELRIDRDPVRARLQPDGMSLVKAGSARPAPITLARVEHIHIIESEAGAAAVLQQAKQWFPVAWDSIRSPGHHGVIADAVTLLDDVAPNYAKWIRHALNFIILLPHIENRSCSGSWADASGMIYMTKPVSALEAAEILVHESSHQYFHMLERTSDVCKPGQREMFYSPPVKRDRPLDRILIAYHAFANVLIMYMAAFEQGHGDQYTVNRFHAFCEDVATLEGYLDRSTGLSDLGLTLFLPLRAALAAARADFVRGTQGVERLNLFPATWRAMGAADVGAVPA